MGRSTASIRRRPVVRTSYTCRRAASYRSDGSAAVRSRPQPVRSSTTHHCTVVVPLARSLALPAGQLMLGPAARQAVTYVVLRVNPRRRRGRRRRRRRRRLLVVFPPGNSPISPLCFRRPFARPSPPRPFVVTGRRRALVFLLAQ
jgi:hypothetical protein